MEKSVSELTIQNFIKKQEQLKRAIQRVQDKLESFKEEAQKIIGDWTDAHREKFKRWNDWHDLKERLKNRVWKNWSEYKSWHWGEYGFNSY